MHFGSRACTSCPDAALLLVNTWLPRSVRNNPTPGALLPTMSDDPTRHWLKALGAKLRDDLGDCPTLPDDLRQLLEQLRTNEASGNRPAGKDRPKKPKS